MAIGIPRTTLSFPVDQGWVYPESSCTSSCENHRPSDGIELMTPDFGRECAVHYAISRTLKGVKPLLGLRRTLQHKSF